jgi:hypothetical protein
MSLVMKKPYPLFGAFILLLFISLSVGGCRDGVSPSGLEGEDTTDVKVPDTTRIVLSRDTVSRENCLHWIQYHRKIASGTFVNDGLIDGSTDTLAASTGPLFGWDSYVNGGNPTLSGGYAYGVGLLIHNTHIGINGKTFVTNKVGNTIKANVKGKGMGIAAGVYSLQFYGSSSDPDCMVFHNRGLVEGNFGNKDGTSAGIYHYSLFGGSEVSNFEEGIFKSSATYYASGVYLMNYFGPVRILNKGLSSGTATGSSAGKAYATGIDLFSYDGGSASPIRFENTGIVTASTTGGTTRQTCYGAFVWAEGGAMTLINSGEIRGTSTSHAQTDAFGVYCGGNRGTDRIVNTGTISGQAGGKGGWALGIENDGKDSIIVENSGVITHNNGLGLALFIGAGPAIITNTGSIFGGLFGISCQTYPGNVTVHLSGSLKSDGNAMVLGSGNDVVNLTGLPDIVGVLDGNGGTNTLNINLKGNLEMVNGVAASKGNDLSVYGLGKTGNLVVSGKTYSWKNFYVSGKVYP